MKTDNRKLMSRWPKLLCVAAAIASGQVWAESRALLIGIGEYQNSNHNLPGIDTDVEIMRDVAGRLGYRDSQIKVLQNEEVTRENLERVFDEWLVQGVTRDDKVLIYYSGHGSQLEDQPGANDEADGYDETLTLYELGSAGAKDLGMLRDDDLAQMLARIPAKNTALIVDACCSGTTTKSLTIGSRSKPYKSKSYNCPSYANADKGARVPDSFLDRAKSFGIESTAESSGDSVAESAGNVVYLSAAQDHEAAQAGPDGSLFTLGLQDAFDNNREASPRQLQREATRYIAEKLETRPSLLFHPNLLVDADRASEKGLFVVERQPPRQVASERWRAIAEGGEGILKIHQPVANYRENEAISFIVEMPFEGYLNVVSVDSEDNVKIMYPNRRSPVSKRRGAIPLELPNDPKFQWVAQAPHGQTDYIVIATREPFNLYENSLDFKDGVPLTDFLKPSVASVRGMGRQAAQTGASQSGSGAARISYHAGLVQFNTCASGC